MILFSDKKCNLNRGWIIMIKLFVVSHKFIDYELPKSRELIKVGNATFEASFIDSTGDNISFKNISYCELTALYWIWKNTSYDIIGIEHYRRFFLSKKQNLFKDIFLNEKEIIMNLNKNDLIVPKKYYIKIGNNVEEEYKLGQKIGQNHISTDFDVLEKVFKEVYTDYYSSFIKMKNLKYYYPFNMFICKRDILDKYCDFLFKVLEECEKYIDISKRNGNQKRAYGYLAERLLNVFIIKHHLKTSEMNVLFYKKEKVVNKILRRSKRFLKSFFRIER